MTKLIRLALVASVLYGTGAHWAVLQTYAWATMSMTGQTDPCRVCRIVEKGSTNPSPAPFLSGAAVDFAVSVAPLQIAVLSASAAIVLTVPTASSVALPPFVPPPKNRLPA